MLKKYKKWEELSRDEKIESLRMEYERPQYVGFMLLMLSLCLVAVTMMFSAQNRILINDIFLQSDMPNWSVYADRAFYGLNNEIGMVFGLTAFGMWVLVINGTYRQMKWKKRWRRFMNDIQKGQPFV